MRKIFIPQLLETSIFSKKKKKKKVTLILIILIKSTRSIFLITRNQS